MRKMKLLAVGLAISFMLTGCGLLDSLPAVYDVEEAGADFDTGELELPQISLEEIQFPNISLEDFKLENFLSGEFKLPEISLEDVLKAYGSQADKLTEEEKDAKYKEYLAEMWKEALGDYEGIEDIDLNFEDTAGGEKLTVDIDFEELVGDKDALKEEITKALEKFFADYEGLTIDIHEE